MPAELRGDVVLIDDQSTANRIYNKGRYGRPLSGGALELSLMEAAYLVETDRLAVHGKNGPLAWRDLIVHAVGTREDFEIRYLVYRDLRARGYVAQDATAAEAKSGSHFRLWARGHVGRLGSPALWIRTVNERAPFVLAELLRFAHDAAANGAQALLALVDEESDLTYYELTQDVPRGDVPPQPTPPLEATLLADRVLVVDERAPADLHEREFFGHPVASGLQLSLVEALYLVEAQRLHVQEAATGKPLALAALRRAARQVEPEVELRLRVFQELKSRGLIVKTGFKFGTHFRAYETRPEEGHAPYLVQAAPKNFTGEWAPLARAVRLSHSVRKRLYLAAVGPSKIDYLAFGRFRP